MWWKHKVSLARGLSAVDWLNLLEAWWTLPAYWLALRWQRYDHLHYDSSTGSPDLPRAERLHRLVLWASRLHFLPMTCLVQSCTLRRMAARRGIQAQVRIGVARTAHDLHAHAWVEVNGHPIGEEGITEKFKALTKVPGE